MLSQPFLKIRKFDSTRLLQRARREPAHPVVVDPQGCCYGPMMPDCRFNRLPGFFDSFFNIHAVFVLTL